MGIFKSFAQKDPEQLASFTIPKFYAEGILCAQDSESLLAQLREGVEKGYIAEERIVNKDGELTGVKFRLVGQAGVERG